MVSCTFSLPMLGSSWLEMQKHSVKWRPTQALIEVQNFSVIGTMFLALCFHLCCLIFVHLRTSSNAGLPSFLQLPNLSQENERVSFHGSHMSLHTETHPDNVEHWFYWTQLSQPLWWKKQTRNNREKVWYFMNRINGLIKEMMVLKEKKKITCRKMG